MTLADLKPQGPADSGWAVLDVLPIQVSMVDAHGVVIATNGAWREAGGPASGETVSSLWNHAATEALVRSTLQLGLEELLAGRRDGFEIEYPVDPGGEPRWLALSVTPSSDGAILAQRDVTARRRADVERADQVAVAHVDRALAKAGRELMASLELPQTLERLCRLACELLRADSSHSVLWHEEDECYTTAASRGDTPENTEALRNMRLPRSAFIGPVALGEDVDVCQVAVGGAKDAPLRTLGARLGVRCLLEIPLRHGDTQIGFQTACRRRDEPFTEIEERLAARLGTLASMAIENARLVGQLDEANKLKGEFVATVSHELRTPIHVVLGFADLLLEGEFGALGEDQRDAVNRILLGARSLMDLSEAALQLTRLDAAQVPVQIEEVELGDLLDEIESEIHDDQLAPKVSLERRIAENLSRIRSDRAKLKLILKNLLSNALKFTERGSVTVSARRRADDVTFVVTDTGIGIEPDALATIFEPFRQADGSTARRYGGIGLGLHIVRRATERLGGTVRAQSTLGEGSRFEVVLPSGDTSA